MLKLSVYEERDAARARLGRARARRRPVAARLVRLGRRAARRAAAPDRRASSPTPTARTGGPITYTWGVVDAAGAAVVLEWVLGALRVHNNSAVGVLTNDPTWEWHVANLNNYAALQRSWVKPNTDGIEVPVDDEYYAWRDNFYYDPAPPAGARVGVPAPIGHGFNLLGMPGDGAVPRAS